MKAQGHAKTLPPLLFLMVLALAVPVLQQSHRYRHLENEIAVTSRKRIATMEKQKIAARAEKVFSECAAKLAEHEKNIPSADGFIWISRVLQEGAPKLILKIDPPEMSAQEILQTSDYCTGTFRVESKGEVGDLAGLLSKIESKAPFCRVQELYVRFTGPKKEEIEFSFSLLAVLRLNDEPERQNDPAKFASTELSPAVRK